MKHQNSAQIVTCKEKYHSNSNLNKTKKKLLKKKVNLKKY